MFKCPREEKQPWLLSRSDIIKGLDLVLIELWPPPAVLKCFWEVSPHQSANREEHSKALRDKLCKIVICDIVICMLEGAVRSFDFYILCLTFCV